MRLKIKFEDITVMFEGQEGSLGYDELCNASNECVKIAEDFAISFGQFLNNGRFTMWGNSWINPKKNKDINGDWIFYETKELLEIYKNEKEL